MNWLTNGVVNMLVILLLISADSVADTRNPETYFFNESFGNFAEELENARAENKKGLLIMFVEDDCPYCHRMRTTVLNQKQVQDFYRDNFLIFEVNIAGDVEITDFKGRLKKEKDFAFQDNRVRATPVFAFYDLDGKHIVRFTGAATGVEEFMLLGKYAVDGEYRTMSFNRYKRKQAK